MKIRTCHRALLLTTLLLACAAAPPLQAQVPDPAPRPPQDQLRTLTHDELGIIKVLTNQERAWNQGDLNGFASGYKDSPDTLFIGSQVSRGFASLLADYRKNYPTRETMGTLSFAELEPRLLDDRFAVVVGRYHLERPRKAGGPADGMFSLVMEKTEKGWKIVVDHTT